MPSAFASFASGVFVATLVLTHDATFGDEILLARGLLARPPAPSASPDENPNVVMPTSGGFLGTLRDAPGETSATASDASADAPSDLDDRADGEVAFRAPPVADAADGVLEGVYLDDDVADDVASCSAASRGPLPSDAFAANLTTRESFAAAMASTKLALSLWARTARPATDALSRYARAGASEMTDAAWRFLRDTPPEDLAVYASLLISAAATVSALLALARHLRRARYLHRARAAAARARTRVAASLRRRVRPVLVATSRARAFARAVATRYHAFIRGVKAKSKVAAALAPHVIVFAAGGALVAALPDWARRFARKREVVASAALLAPVFATTRALERCGSRGKATPRKNGGKTRHAPAVGRDANDPADDPDPDDDSDPDPTTSTEGAEAWLRFWTSAAPLMFALDLPFAASAVHAFCPAWPELTLLWTAWLTFPMSRGAVLITRAAAAHVARGRFAGGDRRGAGDSRGSRLSSFVAKPLARGRRLLDAAALRTLRSFAWALRLSGFARASAALSLALDNTTLPMVGCVLFFFTPSFLTSYGCAVAALAIPAAASLDALSPVDADGRPRTPVDRADRVCAQLRYWLAYSMVWSLARELSRGALSWFPLWRHAELASAFYLSVFGGADEVTRRVFAVKEGIVVEHKQAAARAREAKEAARLERSSGSRDSLSSLGRRKSVDREGEASEGVGDGDRVGAGTGRVENATGSVGVGLAEETLRRRANAGEKDAMS